MPENRVKARERFLSRLDAAFAVTVQDARGIMARFHAEMRRGLAGRKSSLKMIPAFVERPAGTESGDFLALDLGGTNMRVLAVRLDGKGGAAPACVSRFVIPAEVMTGSGEDLFDFIADCISAFFREHRERRRSACALAFAFSFPVMQRSVASGELVCWTKGFTASGVEGRDVVALLNAALQRRQMEFIRVAALANDTVGTLAAGSYADPACDMGVILGTGTNACYPEKAARIPKIRNFGDEREMIVNIEWGSFDKLPANLYDAQLDRASPNAGRQRLEKMVSGLYLGEIARRIIAEMIEQGLLLSKDSLSAFSEGGSLTAAQLSDAMEDIDFVDALGIADASGADRQTLRKISRIVSVRSARIAASAIAAVVTWMDAGLEKNHTVAIDGALYERHSAYRDSMLQMLRELLGARAGKITLRHTPDGSGIGAAVIAAAVASAGRRGV